MKTRSKTIKVALNTALIGSLVLSGCSQTKQLFNPSGKSSEAAAQALVKQAQEAKAKGKTAEADAKSKEAASYYARIGELLLMPEGFKYADDMFAKALELDPTNGKANFYKAMTEPMLQLQGFIPRLESIATQDQVAKLEQLRTDIAKLNMPELKDFSENLPSGAADFQNYHDVQRFARETILPSLLASLDKLSKIDLTNSLQLNFTPSRLDIGDTDSTNATAYSDCENGADGWSCTTYSTSSSNKNLFFVDKYDMKAIQSMVRATIDQIRLGTAYSLLDAETAMKRINALSQNSALTDESMTQILEDYGQLGTLESDQQLDEIIASSTQALKDGLELSALSDQLCNGNSRTPLTSLIVPICITSQAANTMQLGLDLLAGPKQISLGADGDGNQVQVEVDVTAVLKNPVTDLKKLLPTKFNDAGYAVDNADHTMGGLFPNGDILDKMKHVADKNNTEDNVKQALQSYVTNLGQWFGINE